MRYDSVVRDGRLSMIIKVIVDEWLKVFLLMGIQIDSVA